MVCQILVHSITDKIFGERQQQSGTKQWYCGACWKEGGNMGEHKLTETRSMGPRCRIHGHGCSDSLPIACLDSGADVFHISHCSPEQPALSWPLKVPSRRTSLYTMEPDKKMWLGKQWQYPFQKHRVVRNSSAERVNTNKKAISWSCQTDRHRTCVD